MIEAHNGIGTLNAALANSSPFLAGSFGEQINKSALWQQLDQIQREGELLQSRFHRPLIDSETLREISEPIQRFAQQDPAMLDPIVKMVQGIMRTSRPLMQQPFFELPHATSGRKRPVRDVDRVRCLRVLDALAAGATGAEIERELYNSTDKGKDRLVRQARDALIDYTGIPL